MGEAKFGIEAEYALVRPDGRFADFTNTRFAEVQPFIDALPDYRHPELRVGDAGIRVKNWYVEGDERFDEEGRSTGMTFKGIEVRTPVAATVAESVASLKGLRAMLEAELDAQGWRVTAIGFNPCTASYAPEYNAWERALQASHSQHCLPEVSTLSYGPDFNFSLPGASPETALETARRLTFYSPFIVPFSFSSPFMGGRLWEGLSCRTYRRTGPRPAALAHLAGGCDDPLAKEADPPSHHLRIEFKAFDMVADERLMEELFHLCLGVALSQLPGRAARPDSELHRRAALHGLDDEEVRRGAQAAVAASLLALREGGWCEALPRIEQMLETRRTPAHAMREQFLRSGTLFAPLREAAAASS